MFILKKGHQPGVYVPLRALFLVIMVDTFKQAHELIDKQILRRDCTLEQDSLAQYD